MPGTGDSTLVGSMPAEESMHAGRNQPDLAGKDENNRRDGSKENGHDLKHESAGVRINVAENQSDAQSEGQPAAHEDLHFQGTSEE